MRKSKNVSGWCGTNLATNENESFIIISKNRVHHLHGKWIYPVEPLTALISVSTAWTSSKNQVRVVKRRCVSPVFNNTSCLCYLSQSRTGRTAALRWPRVHPFLISAKFEWKWMQRTIIIEVHITYHTHTEYLRPTIVSTHRQTRENAFIARRRKGSGIIAHRAKSSNQVGSATTRDDTQV